MYEAIWSTAVAVSYTFCVIFNMITVISHVISKRTISAALPWQKEPTDIIDYWR